MPSFPGTRASPDVLRLLEQGLGGICLFGTNTADGPDALRALVTALRSAGSACVIAIDEEGGDVTRLHSQSGSPWLGALALGTIDDPRFTEAVGRTIGLELATLGITMNLAPVADVNTRAANPVVGTRSFGANPQQVARHTAAWIDGLQSCGIAACAKHFPGHGDTLVDSHLAVPVTDVEMDVLKARELRPFAAAVKADVAAVMTSHIVVTAVDDSLPATFSPDVLGLLRRTLGFNGLVVSDALDMSAASPSSDISQAAVSALAAGVDLLCLGPDKDVELVKAVQAALVSAVQNGLLGEARLIQAAAAVLDFRKRHMLTAETNQAVGVKTRANREPRSVTASGILPSLKEAQVVRVDTEPTGVLESSPWGLAAELVVAPGETSLPGGPLIIQVRDAHRHPQVLKTLAAAPPDCVVVEWGWPAPRATDSLATINAHGWSQPGAIEVAGLLEAAGWCSRRG
jgi:beta-N-acetylhexosaminidase